MNHRIITYNLATGYNWKGSSVTSTSRTHSMIQTCLDNHLRVVVWVIVVFQGYDSNTLTDTTETFVGEGF